MTAEDAAIQFTYRGRRAMRSGSEERRLSILQATLRVIVREGMRGVRHRAIAREAGVPLAATTYYFKDLDELVTDSFLLFASQVTSKNQALEGNVQAALSRAGVRARPGSEGWLELAGAIAEAASTHVMEQAADADARLLEAAFAEEALRNPSLREAMCWLQADHEGRFRQFCERLGSVDPAADARILHATFLHLEFLAVLNPAEHSRALVREQLRRTLIAIMAGDRPA